MVEQNTKFPVTSVELIRSDGVLIRCNALPEGLYVHNEKNAQTVCLSWNKTAIENARQFYQIVYDKEYDSKIGSDHFKVLYHILKVTELAAVLY
jgi:hypothetical protein